MYIYFDSTYLCPHQNENSPKLTSICNDWVDKNHQQLIDCRLSNGESYLYINIYGGGIVL